jgi:Ni/Co efflux regulator RcnB
MKLAIVAFALFQIPMATAVQAQSDSRQTASIPPQFHGRWATDGRACRPRHFTRAIKIDSRGWSSFEEGGRVIRAGQVRRGTHYFRVANWAGGEKIPGVLAVRRAGPLLVMTLDPDNAKPVHHRLIRCR